MFSKPNLDGFDFFDLMWAVGVTDFVLKFVTIGLKCFVLFLPGILLAFKSRVRVHVQIYNFVNTRKAYGITEHVSS